MLLEVLNRISTLHKEIHAFCHSSKEIALLFIQIVRDMLKNGGECKVFGVDGVSVL